MKKKISVAIIAAIIYATFLVCGFLFLDEFSECAFMVSFIYFGVLIFNFYWLTWNNNFLADFIIDHNLSFLLIVLAIIYSATLVISFIKGDGFDRLMYCTAWISGISTSLCSYAYLK